MNPTPDSSGVNEFQPQALEITIRIGVVLFLAAMCFQILRPFLVPVLWGIIIAVAVFPAYQWLESALNGRSRLAAVCVSLVLLVLLLIPVVLLADTLVDAVRSLAERLKNDTLEVPLPPASVVTWPLYYLKKGGNGNFPTGSDGFLEPGLRAKAAIYEVFEKEVTVN